MKNIISLVLLSLSLFTVNVQAQENANPSAPNVVAPAQPAAPATGAVTAPAGAAATPQQQPSMLSMAMPFLIMLGIMYFLMIRPQQKKMKEHQALLTGLKAGDDVVTTSGIFGKITNQNDKIVTLEIANNVQIKVLKSQVNQVLKGSMQDVQA